LGFLNGIEYLDHLAYDSVIFGFAGDNLKILLMEYHDTALFALPGGFVQVDEDLNDAVRRGLAERTGLQNVYLEQFYTFGDAKRNLTGEMNKILNANNLGDDSVKWILNRFVSVAYLALINYKNVNPRPDEISDSCTWYDVNNLPPLIQDHTLIVEKALMTLQSQLDHKIPIFELLEEQFTMAELQRVYEVILNESLHRGSFQRKMLSLGILKRHEKQFNGGAHKAPYLYSFLK